MRALFSFSVRNSVFHLFPSFDFVSKAFFNVGGVASFDGEGKVVLVLASVLGLLLMVFPPKPGNPLASLLNWIPTNDDTGRSKPSSQTNFERNKQPSSISLHKRWPWKHASVTRTLKGCTQLSGLVRFYRAGWVPEWPSGRPGAFDFM